MDSDHDWSPQSVDPRELQTPTEFAAALTSLRERRGLSIRQLSKLTGVPSGTLGGYFVSRHLPNPSQSQTMRDVLIALGVTDEMALAQWREALLRVRKNTRRAASTGGPYRGLESFTEQDADAFFGRSAEIEQLVEMTNRLWDRLDSPRLLFVVGPSGSGKSSLLRAGLAARMQVGASAVALMVPGSQPLVAWENALSAVSEEGHSRRLIIVDQAEEIFSPEVSADQRARFLAGMAESTSDGSATAVVLGLRADFYGQAASERVLLPALQSSQMLLGAMQLDALREAIVKPALEAHVAVDEQFVELVIRDLDPIAGAYDPGALPLLSHALLASWKHHKGARLTVADYLAVGGLRGAVKQSAEEVLASFDTKGQAAAQWLFTRLVLVDGEGAMTRRRLDRDSLQHPDPAMNDLLTEVIESFVSGRLLTAGEETLEISHEALPSAWPRLREWVLSDLDAGRLQFRIALAARQWLDSDRDPDLLLRGAPLLEAQALAAAKPSSPRTLTPAEQEFVTASAEREAAVVRAQQRRTRVLRSAVVVTTILAVVSSLLAVAALRSRVDADRQRLEADRQRQLAEQTTALAVASMQTRTTDPAVSQQVAAMWNDLSPSFVTRSVLLSSTSESVPTRLVGPPGQVHAVAPPDGSVVALSGIDAVTRLWRYRESGGYERLADLPEDGFPGQVVAGGFNRDGSQLVLLDDDGISSQLVVWDTSDVRRPVFVDAAPIKERASTLSLLPGREIAVGMDSGAVATWRIESGRLQRKGKETLTDTKVTALDGSSGGPLLAGSREGQLMAVRSPADIQRVNLGSPTTITDVVSRADGRTAVSAQRSGDLREWSLSRRGLRATGPVFGVATGAINAVAMSPDGTQVASAAMDGHVRIYDMRSRALLADLRTPAAATSVQFVRGGSHLLTGDSGGTARIWPLPVPVLRGFSDDVWSLDVAQEGKLLMVAPGEADGSVQLFRIRDAQSPQPVHTLRTNLGPTNGSGAISGDGQLVAAGTGAGRVVAWRRLADGEYHAVVDLSAGRGFIEGVALSRDGRRLASVSQTGRLRVWRMDGRASQVIGDAQLGAAGFDVAFDPSGEILAAGVQGGAVEVWTVSQDALAKVATLSAFDNDVLAVAFDPTGRYLAAGSADQSIRVWGLEDVVAPTPAAGPLNGPGAVNSLDWSPSGDLLAAASGDGGVWMWNTADLEDIREQAVLTGAGGGELNAVSFLSADVVVGGGVDQVVTRWRTDVGGVASSTCQRTGDGLTEAEWQQLIPALNYAPTC